MIKSPATFSIFVVVVIDVSWKFSPHAINTVKGGYSRDSLQEVNHHSLPQSCQTVPMHKNQRLLQMSYFIAPKKVLDNTAFVVHTVLPALMGNKTKVCVLLLGILAIIDQLGHQCGL